MAEPMSFACNVHATYISKNVSAPVFSHRDNFSFSQRSIHRFLREVVTASALPAVPKTGFLLCLMEIPEPGASHLLQRAFPNFPKSLLSYIGSRNAFAAGTALTPEWRDSLGLSFVENYLQVEENEERFDTSADPPGYQLGSFRIRSMPLAVWTGAHLNNKTSEIPIILVLGHWELRGVMKFGRHCEGSLESETRFSLLEKCHAWICHDLCSAYSDWMEIWDSARTHLGELDQEVHEQIGTINVLERMRKINKATATNIMLRESLSIQQKSLQTILDMVADSSNGLHKDVVSSMLYDFTERCKTVLKAMDHYSVLADSNLAQLQNLLSMMVSLEQISQGQSIGRLNLLAFIFLPLSFVASIFGMTQFTVSPRWYVAYAIPLLTMTLLGAIVMPKILSAWDKKNKKRRVPRQSSIPPQPIPNLRGRSIERQEAGSVYKLGRRSSSLSKVAAPTTSATPTPRRFTLLPASFSLKAISIGKEYGMPRTATEQSNDFPDGRGDSIDKSQPPRDPESRNNPDTTATHPPDRIRDVHAEKSYPPVSGFVPPRLSSSRSRRT